MSTTEAKKECVNCRHSKTFIKRPDEYSNIGCHKSGFEGYTKNENAEWCEHYSPKAKPAQTGESK